ncbi:MAG: Fe-S cluster assembly protein SufD [Candidatus Aenigmatarchaeota archaeon]
MLVTDFLQMIKNRSEPSWLKQRRLDTFTKFSQLKMPDSKEEEWRYIDISQVNLDNVKIDGYTDISIDFGNDVIVLLMKEALNKFSDMINEHAFSLFTDADKFVSFVSSFWNNGVFVYVPKNVQAEFPVTVKINNTNNPVYSLVVLDENSKLNFVEENVADKINPIVSDKINPIVSTSVTEIFVKENSKLNFFCSQILPENLYSFYYKRASVERGAEINWFLGSFGAKLSRWKVETFLKGENAKCQKYGIYAGNKNQHHDIITKTFHLVPHTSNNILVKGVLTGRASSVYRGLIRIEKNAQQTLSYMGAHTLLLSNKAKSNNIPSLEIEANDVRATHGSSVGQLEEEKLFYLMSRGLDRKLAENIIVEGFLETVLNKFTSDEVREKFRAITNERLLNA